MDDEVKAILEGSQAQEEKPMKKKAKQMTTKTKSRQTKKDGSGNEEQSSHTTKTQTAAVRSGVPPETGMTHSRPVPSTSENRLSITAPKQTPMSAEEEDINDKERVAYSEEISSSTRSGRHLPATDKENPWMKKSAAATGVVAKKTAHPVVAASHTASAYPFTLHPFALLRAHSQVFALWSDR